MRRVDFLQAGGMDASAFEAYYEDTDLQMRLTHTLAKRVWYQPLAVARHHEHGSFGGNVSKLMRQSHATFYQRWHAALKTRARHTLDYVGVMRASDSMELGCRIMSRFMLYRAPADKTIIAKMAMPIGQPPDASQVEQRKPSS